MTDIANCGKDLIAYLVAEFRCAAQRARLAADDLDAISLALKGGLVTPYQAMVHIEETRRISFSGKAPRRHLGERDGPRARGNTTNRNRNAPKLTPS